jgi:hypothetical protein
MKFEKTDEDLTTQLKKEEEIFAGAKNSPKI